MGAVLEISRVNESPIQNAYSVISPLRNTLCIENQVTKIYLKRKSESQNP